LDASSAFVEGVAGQADDVEGIHDCGRVGEFLGGGGLEPGETVHGDDLDAVAPGVLAFGEPGLEGLLGAAFDHVEQPCGSSAVADTAEVDDHGDVLVATSGVAPHSSSTPIAVTPSKRCWSLIRTRLPSARIASLAVFQETPRPSATR